MHTVNNTLSTHKKRKVMACKSNCPLFKIIVLTPEGLPTILYGEVPPPRSNSLPLDIPFLTEMVLYSTANDPQNGPQMILDRKWSLNSTANDPVKTWGMEWILWDWLQKRTDYKKESFFSRLLKKKGRRTLHLRSIYTRRKKSGINLKRCGINRILLPLSIASIFFQECFVFWKI